jgi:iron-sulfur cluster assembly protein
MFILTPAAASRILESARQSDADGMPLRVAAKIEESGDMTFGLGFDDEREHDLTIECEGVTLLIAPPSLEFLTGMGLDFIEVEAGEWEFVFFQAATTTSCPPSSCGGCGSRGGCSGGDG